MTNFQCAVCPKKDIHVNILLRLTHDHFVYVPSGAISADFCRVYPRLISEGYIDVASTRYRRTPNVHLIVLKPGVVIVPDHKKFTFYKNP